MDVRLRKTTKLCQSALITVATHLLFCANGLSADCSFRYSTVVNCINANLTTIPNWIPSNVTEIDLSYNPFLKLQTDSFIRFTNLQTLALRRCNLNQSLQFPKSLEDIDLSYNPFLKLKENSFARFTNLRSLRLRRSNLNLPLQLPNNLLEIYLAQNSFSVENVAAMFKRMQDPRIRLINLEANNLTLDGILNVFSKSVRSLFFSKNILRKIEADDLKGFSHLRFLDLSSTGLHTIAAGAFDDLKELYAVHLCDNNIENLPKRLFENVPYLYKVKLEDNYLRDIPDLSGIRLLQRLDLSRNRIKTVHGRSFGVEIISYINLASNEIQSFNFSGLTYQFLDISNNHISSIQQGSLGDAFIVYALFLQRNNITSLTRACFQGIQEIEELHLQSNKLQWIEKGTFRDMSIERLLLFNNSLVSMNGVMEGMKIPPQLLLLFGNPNISLMRTSDYENMATGSQIYISCSSIKTFSSPFILKARLICSPTEKLVMETQSKSLEGNGFDCIRMPNYVCYSCKPGEYDAAMYHKDKNCVPCPYGAFYQDEMASVDCKKCPLGQHVPPYKGPGKSPLDCLTCPKGTNTNASAGYRACHCLPGYSRKYRFGACEKCNRDGFQCKKDYPELMRGYWMSWDNIKTCRDSFMSFMSNLDTKDDTYDRNANYFNCSLPIAHKCPIAKSCEGGVDAICGKGYTGVLCAVCDSGYMKHFNKCVQCSSPVVSVFECIAYFFSFVILCWLMSKLRSITLVGKYNENNERTFADLIQSSLKILMGFYQVLVRIIYAFSSIHWPSTLTNAVKVFEFVELSVLRIPSLHCIQSDWRLNAIGEFWISLTAMVAIPSLVLIFFALKEAISFHCASRENFGQKRKMSLKNCLQSIVLFFFATYPFISTKIFHVLPGSCHTLCTVKENGHCLNQMSYLRNDYSVECPQAASDVGFNAIYAYVSLLIPIGVPCLLLYLLWRFAPKQTAELQPQRHLNIECQNSQENEDQCYLEWEGYKASLYTYEVVNPEEKSVAAFALKMTYGNYKTSCWYWEFVEMIRKLLMVIASSFLLQNVKIGLYSNIILSIVFVVLHVRKWPMKDSFDNYMQLLALVSVTVNLCYSVTKASNIGDANIINTDKDVFGLGLMLVCLNSLVVILIVGRFVKEVAVKLIQRYCIGSCSLCCSLQCCNVQCIGRQDNELLL